MRDYHHAWWGERAVSINEACFKANALEVVMALVGDDVVFWARNPDDHWTTVVWPGGARAYYQLQGG